MFLNQIFCGKFAELFESFFFETMSNKKTVMVMIGTFVSAQKKTGKKRLKAIGFTKKESSFSSSRIPCLSSLRATSSGLYFLGVKLPQHWNPTQPPWVQVEKEAVEVATDAQRGGDNLCGEDQASHDNENIEEVVCFPTSKKTIPKKNWEDGKINKNI